MYEVIARMNAPQDRRTIIHVCTLCKLPEYNTLHLNHKSSLIAIMKKISRRILMWKEKEKQKI